MKINEKNLCAFASSPPFDMDGHLMKRGEVNKSFQLRYFVLKGNLLFYFEKKGDREPLGLILLEGCTIELSAESDQYCFEIAFNGNRTYVLTATSQETMECWMKALTCAGYEYKKLMVAELQRKLNEIEDSQNKILSEATSVVPQVPQPPPRRYNPFNNPRPAPPPPLPANSNGHEITPSYSALHFADHSRIGQPHSNSGVQSSNAANADRFLGHHPANINKTPILAVLPSLKAKHRDAIDFNVLHARFRELVMIDVDNYRLKEKLKSQPLIQL